jgi:uncharacterized circularly permuted ATP-grasp superfamily protein/uncharacterized alpha-E superfamily protein
MPDFDPPTEPLRADLLAGYDRRAGAFDELFATGVSPLPHWDYLLRGLKSLSRRELTDRDRETRRLLRENGVTYNVREDAGPRERLWGLDPVPVLFTSGEWSRIEAGLIQRAELLDEMLRDLYGERKLLKRGLIPAELVFAHRGYLRPCVQLALPRGSHMQLYAADLVRRRDGAMVVVADRTQAPSGAGYALENRLIASSVFPSLYRDSNVHRLAVFFRAMRTMLQELGSRLDDNPRVVVLTPGPANETYFEQAYLANYLGYSLAQGHDLTVRDGKVWLKTLDGLKPVHVILRRVDDDYCDPLELRMDSLLGVPGLVEAARRGQVALGNPLGSGLAQNAGLHAYLPAICRELMGQDLLLPSADTWWFGDPVARDHALRKLDRLIVKGIHALPGLPVFGGDLSENELDELRRRIRRAPHLYVGQDHIRTSTVPSLTDGALRPRPMVLRSFLVARGESFTALPGGLTRVGVSRDDVFVSNQRGGISKDTWILASEREQRITLLPPATPLVSVALSRSGGEVPSRVADHLFWVGRYAERADFATRPLREVFRRLSEADGERQTHLDATLEILTHVTCSYPGFAGEDRADRRQHPDAELHALLTDRFRGGGLAAAVDGLMHAAVSVRDRFSDDGWHILRELSDGLFADRSTTDRSGDDSAGGNPSTGAFSIPRSERMLEQVGRSLAAFNGLIAEGMSRDQGFHFIDVGRRIERAVGLANLLRAAFLRIQPFQPWLLEFLLSVNDSRTTYSRRYRLDPQAGPVLDLTMLDRSHPRSLAYQLHALADLVAVLPEPVGGSTASLADIIVDVQSRAGVYDSDSLALFATDDSIRVFLGELLDDVISRMGDLSDSVTRLYFEHAELPQQMVAIR